MSSNNEQVFPVTFAIACHQPALSRADVPDGHGACTALLTAAISAPINNAATVTFKSINGLTGEQLTPSEQFEIWHQLAKGLAHSLVAGTGRQELCGLVVQTIETAAKNAQGGSDV